ncbi:MAG TPA: twin-arginine translocase subunit TatC [Thermoplasmata archaeon]|nr:twin-arginine translocase subunit TatC [Thermoplasmata archaeon]
MTVHASPDEADATRMSFWEHIEELRDRFKFVVVLILVLFVLFMTFGLGTLNVGGTHVPMLLPAIGSDPVSTAAFHGFVAFLVPSWVQLAAAHPWDGVLVQVEMALFLAFVVGSPAIAYEMIQFVGPALKPSEKRLLRRMVVPISALFFAGVALDLLILLPFTINFLYQAQRGLGITLYILFVGDFVSFVVIHVLAFGFAFELPMVMYGLTSVGITRGSTWTRHWRIVIVAIWFIAGMITPDPSGVTMIIVGLILTGLYLLGVVAARYAEGRRDARAHLTPSP